MKGLDQKWQKLVTDFLNYFRALLRVLFLCFLVSIPINFYIHKHLFLEDNYPEGAKEHFNTYIKAFVLSAPLLKENVNYMGHQVPAKKTYYHMKKILYQGQTPIQILYSGKGLISNIFAFLLPLGFISYILIFRVGKKKHVSGSLEYDETKKNKLGFKKKDRLEISNPGIKYFNQAIPKDDEFKHAVITGATGTGKSHLIKSILKQIEDRKETAIVCDPEGEMIPLFFNKDRGDVILNPADIAFKYWDPWLELTNFDGQDPETKAEAMTIAASFIPDEEPGKTNHFVDSARKVLTSVLLCIPEEERDMEGLKDWLRKPFLDIHRLLMAGGEEIAANTISPDSERTATDVYSTLSKAMVNLDYLPSKRGITVNPGSDNTNISSVSTSDATWSAKDWSKKRQGWIFLCSGKENLREPLYALHNLWINLLITSLMSEDVSSEEFKKVSQVWFIIDELPALGKLDKLETFVDRARKYKLCGIFGLQSIPQIDRIYGKNTRENILNNVATLFALQGKCPDTADILSKIVGEKEEKSISVGQSVKAGGKTDSGSYSMSEKSTRKRILPAEKIQTLKVLHYDPIKKKSFTGEGFLVGKGWVKKVIVRPYKHFRELRRPKFIPRNPRRTKK